MAVDPALFAATNCLCSALLCNCPQISCGCVPAVGRGRSSSSLRSATVRTAWMTQLGQVLTADVRFRDLILVGTHNAASSSISRWRPFSAVAICQSWDIRQQLEAGLRVLDVRMAPCRPSHSTPSRWSVWHGPISGGDMATTVLRPVRGFAHEYKHEVIVIFLTPEWGHSLTATDRHEAMEFVHRELGGARTLLHARHLSDLLNTWTLRHIQEQQQCRLVGNVLVLVHPRFFDNLHVSDTATFLLDRYGFGLQDQWCRSAWMNTRHPTTLLSSILDDVTRFRGDGISSHRPDHSNKFHLSQLVLTPGVGSLIDVVAACVGMNSLRPVSLADALYREHLGRFLRLHVNMPWQWLWLDFVDLSDIFVHFWTALNFPIPMHVHLAVLETKDANTPGSAALQDVTEAISACVCRSRILFVESLHNVLGVSSKATSGTVTIVYRLDGVYQAITQPLTKRCCGKSSMLLLSGLGHWCHDEDAVTTLPSDQHHFHLFSGSVLSSNVPLPLSAGERTVGFSTVR